MRSLPASHWIEASEENGAAMKKVLYSIGEVAGILGESVPLVRFWSNTFPKFIHPVRNAKGNRLFSAEDVETFRQIHYLVGTGLKLEGVARRLRDEKSAVAAEVKVVDSLKAIREQLLDVRASLSKGKSGI